jgi:hypothetical protein
MRYCNEKKLSICNIGTQNLPSFESYLFTNDEITKPLTGRESTWVVDISIGLGCHPAGSSEKGFNI